MVRKTLRQFSGEYGEFFTVTKRQTVLIRDDFICTYCPKEIKDDSYEIDHINPVANKGVDGYKNLTLSCRNCNRTKSDVSVKKFFGKKIRRNAYSRDSAVVELLSNKRKALKFISIYQVYKPYIEELKWYI